MSYYSDIKQAALADLPWNKLSGKNILITGATGLIGSAIVEILMSRSDIDFDIYASGRNKNRFDSLFSEFKSSPHLHFLQYDVTEPLTSSVEFHFVISAASGANPILYSTRPVDVMKSNIMGVDNILSYCKDHGLQKMVYVSSGDVYGEGDGRVFTEEYSGYANPLSIRSCYTSSKRASETLCISYASQYGIDVSIARPCHTYGPHFTDSDTRVYAQFIRNAIRGENIIMKSSGEQFRSWCYVVDSALGILFILLKGENCQAYNIADDNSNITIKELAEMIAEAGGTKVVMDIPDEVERKGYNSVSRAVFDTLKLRNLGWHIEGCIKMKIDNVIEFFNNENKNVL